MDSLKSHALLDFFRMEGYDAVALSGRELQLGVDLWQRAAANGVPIVVANLFRARSSKPLFTPYIIKSDHGRKLGVIGFVSESAWNARRDTTLAAGFKPPHEMGKLVQKVAKKSDHLTVMGDFTADEADTLATRFPQIDLIVSSGIKSAERAKTLGRTVITGTAPKGYFANYIEFTPEPTETVSFNAGSQTLDESVPVDSTVQHVVDRYNESIKSQVQKLQH